MGWKADSLQRAARAHAGELRYWMGTAATLLSVALLVRNVDFPRAADAFAAIDYPLAAICLLTVVLTILLKAVRWKTLFQPSPIQPSASQAVSILTVGQMINILFPFRLGEVGRVYLAGELGGLPASLTTATIVVEKIIDSLMLLICVALLVPFTPLPVWLREPALAITGIALTAVALVLSLARCKRGVRAILARVLGILPRDVRDSLGSQVETTLESVAYLRQLLVLAQVALLSVIIWVLAALTNYTAFLCLSVPAPFIAAVFLLVVLQIGVAIPSAPGRLGVFQALTVLALAPFEVDASTALTYSIFLHLVVFLPPSAAGIILLWLANATIRKEKVARPQP